MGVICLSTKLKVYSKRGRVVTIALGDQYSDQNNKIAEMILALLLFCIQVSGLRLVHIHVGSNIPIAMPAFKIMSLELFPF